MADGRKHFDLFDLGIINGPRERSFEGIVALTAKLFEAPISLLTIVDDAGDRQQFKAQVGLPEPYASERGTPLNMSFCRLVRDRNWVLAADDTRKHPLLYQNPAIELLGMRSYLGAPIYGPASEPIGALAAADIQPRTWSSDDIDYLKSLADLATQQIMLRATLQTIKIMSGDLSRRRSKADERA